MQSFLFVHVTIVRTYLLMFDINLRKSDQKAARMVGCARESGILSAPVEKGV